MNLLPVPSLVSGPSRRFFPLMSLATALLAVDRAPAAVVVLTSKSTSPTTAFSFPGLGVQLSGANRGNSPNAIVSVIQGSLGGASGAVTKLNDGSGETSSDVADTGNSLMRRIPQPSAVRLRITPTGIPTFRPAPLPVAYLG